MSYSTKTDHVERTAQEPRDSALHPVTLAKIDYVNAHVRLYKLELQNGPVSFLPGQWLDTYVPSTPKAGGFTITSSPSSASRPTTAIEKPYLELAVQKSPSNPPAAYLWRDPSEILGTTLNVRIGGSFVFPPLGWELGDLKKVIFIAGGVGINPVASMVASIAQGKVDVEVEVLYGSKVPSNGVEGVLFAQRIGRWFGEGQLRGKMSLFATGEDVEAGQTRNELRGEFEVVRGRMSREHLVEAVGQGEEKGKVVYICGPPTMTDALVHMLVQEKVIDERRIMTEKWW